MWISDHFTESCVDSEFSCELWILKMNVLTSNSAFVFERGIRLWVYGLIDDIQVAFHILKKNPEWSTTMWEKSDQPWASTMETNINTIQAVIDDDEHLSTRALQVLLHIPWAIIHCILTEKLEMMHVASTWVPHMLTSDAMRIHVENTSKFLGFIAEDSTYVKWVVTCDETWEYHCGPLTMQESEH